MPYRSAARPARWAALSRSRGSRVVSGTKRARRRQARAYRSTSVPRRWGGATKAGLATICGRRSAAGVAASKSSRVTESWSGATMMLFMCRSPKAMPRAWSASTASVTSWWVRRAQAVCSARASAAGSAAESGKRPCEDGVERGAGDELHGQEAVFAHGVQSVHAGDARQPFEGAQGRVLPLQAGDRVGPVGGEPGVRPALLEHHGLTGLPVRTGVHPAPVGEVQGAFDGVREIGRALGGAGLGVRAQEVGEFHPVGEAEGGAAGVRDEAAGRVGHRRDQGAVGGAGEAGREGAVADVDRALAPAQVAEDDRSRAALEGVGEFGGEFAAGGGGGRVDGDELAAAGAVGVLGVAVEQQGGPGEELEGGGALLADPGDRLQDLFGVVRRRGDVDLPALGGELAPGRGEREPVTALGALPALGGGAPGEGVTVTVAAVAVAVGRTAGPARGVVEPAVGTAVERVLRIHRSPSPSAFPCRAVLCCASMTGSTLPVAGWCR